MDRISILLAVHDGARFLAEAIQSVVDQTYPHWELMVVSNGSTDQTVQISRAYGARDPRIRAYVLPEKGKNAAYNFAYRQATGSYLCFFAADDLLPRDSLEERLQVLQGKPGDCYSTCCLKTISSDAKYDGIVFPRRRDRPNYSGGSLFFTRALAERLFPLPVEQPNEDTWTQLHLRAFGRNHHISKALYLYRIHPGNSYGYSVGFTEKRTEYLRRMHAYQLFHDKYASERLPFVAQEVVPFLKGLRAARNKRMLQVLLVPGLSAGSRLMLAFYCSSALYRLRHAFFRTFSWGLGK